MAARGPEYSVPAIGCTATYLPLAGCFPMLLQGFLSLNLHVSNDLGSSCDPIEDTRQHPAIALTGVDSISQIVLSMAFPGYHFHQPARKGELCSGDAYLCHTYYFISKSPFAENLPLMILR